MASWQAARSGLEGRLIHPLTTRPEPAADVAHALLTHVGDALEDSGDLVEAEKALRTLLKRGTGARAQREVLAGSDSLRTVVTECAARTLG